jgi:mannose-6-phosphate isomerase
MSELYPLKFKPILKEKIWGGHSLVRDYGKPGEQDKNIGESWEISAVSDDLSVVSNGFLEGNNIEEIIEVYMGDITGDSVYEKFGNEFPLLIKFIEAAEDLSIQVHPGNELARKRHNAYGKTEMWYILQSEPTAKIYTGFTKPVTKEQYQIAFNNNKLAALLNTEHPEHGDVFFTPAGRVHAIGAGNVLVEIQQTSDITYRIYDWGRKGSDGKPRELHSELALDAIDYSSSGKNKFTRESGPNRTENLIRSEFFTTNILQFDKKLERDYYYLDSFVIYICTEGKFTILWDDRSEAVPKGETVLIPAALNNFVLKPEPAATLLEIYVESDINK